VALKLQPRDAGVVDVELTYSATPPASGARDQIRWMARDVTEHERMARQIRALNAQLESRVAAQTADLSAAQRLAQELVEKEQEARRAAAASEAQSRHVQKLESIGVLAGGIAHDFNNLLHVVLGNADIALSNLNSGSLAREPLEEVVRATLRAADLTRQLLAYSGKGAFVVRHLDLSTEVREMATLLRTSISKQATLAWELASDLPAISADPTQIRQVVMNLITNASDALGEGGGTITLCTGVVDLKELEQQRFGRPPHGEDPPEAEPGPLVYLEIGDTGQGMSPDTLSRIFDPFFSTKFSGRGLGLAAVMGIVRSHHGFIRIRTELGKGTAFRVLFPAVGGAAPKFQKPSSERSEWRGSGTILVVEDEEGVREVAERMLQDIGFETVGAEDGRHALDLMEEVGDRVTAVLLDLSMPRMGGAETFRRLREMKPDLPILMMSGYTEQVVAPQFNNSGPGTTGFLQKPFLAEDLIAVLRRFAESATG
jgi:signal transduction histidine kinase/ActR/RegA family two-component response regulator